MEIYKLATREQYRYTTAKGNLSTEQLWDLNLKDLNTLAVALDAEYNKSGEKSFLETKSVKDKTLKNKFDVVFDILNTKKEEAAAQLKAKEEKERKTKILELIEEKQSEGLRKKSIAQLKKML